MPIKVVNRCRKEHTMEKGTILRNVNNGKVGTVVQYQEKFGHVILEVEGKNVDYNVSTIKRWWKPVEGSTPEQDNLVAMPGIELDPVEGRERGRAQSCKKETPVKQNKSETTSTPEPKAPKTSTLPSKQVNGKAKSKKSSSPKTSKGPDAEVFSYITKQAKEHKFSFIHRPDSEQYGNGRWVLLGRPNAKGKVVCVMQIYVGNKNIRVLVSHKNTDKAPTSKDITVNTRKGINLDKSYVFDIKLYTKFIDKFLELV